MKKLIAILVLTNSISAFAETCIGEAPDTLGEVVPVLCAESITATENGTYKIQGLYLNPGHGLDVGVKPRFKKEVCKAFNFSTYVKDSAVVERTEIFVSRQGMLVPGQHRVLTAVECK